MRIRKNDFSAIILILILLILCSAFSNYRFSAFISIAGFGVFICWIVYRKAEFLFKYFPLVTGAGMFLIGVVVCDFTKTRLYEINDDAHFVGAVPFAVLLQVIFMIGLMAFEGKGVKQNISVIIKKKYPVMCHYIAIVASLAFFVMFLRIARYPAFLLGYDRFQYAALVNSNTGIWRVIDSISYALIIFPLLDFVNGHKITGIIGGGAYVLYYLWNGNKFGPFFTLLIVFFLVDYENIIKRDKKQIKRIVIIGILAVFVLVLLAAVIVAKTKGVSVNVYINNRIGQQGQLWWKTYYLTGSPHFGEIQDEINGAIHGSSNIADNVNSNFGMYKIMYLCGEPSYIRYKLGAGSRFTEAGLAGAYYYGGKIGSIIYVLINALIMAKTLKAFLKAIKRRSYIEMAILARLYTVERLSFSMFLFNDYFDVISIISYVVLFGLWITRRKRIMQGVLVCG